MRKFVVDTFGADKGEEVIVKGAFTALEKYPEFGAVFCGSRAVFEKALSESTVDESRAELVETDDFITNDEIPVCIFNGRDSSSMALALERLKADPSCFAMLSAGNTGALFVGSVCRLGTEKGLKSPVLSSALPTVDGGWVCLLDCGSRMACDPADMLTFATLGSDFARLAFGCDKPKVGLLSVGKEQEKGSELTKAAFPLLRDSGLNFIGNVESCDLLSGEVDVVVCDGFSGNILLKNVEATGKAAMKLLSDFKAKNADLSDEIYVKIQDTLSQKFDLNLRGGATFLGTKKPIIKMHGCAEELTILSCIDQLIRVETAYQKNKQN